MGTRANYTIEAAMPGDEESIARLIHELAEYEKAPRECHATPAEVKKHLFGRKTHAECLVARVGGEIVAFALFFTNFSTWKCKPGLYLEDLYVQPAHRKAGIGRALLARLGAICLERDCARMEWAVLEWNELAKAQYRKLGAAPMDEWRTWRLTGDELARLGREGEALIAAAADGPAAPAAPADSQDSGGRVVIYTDGGAKPNPGVGAWAAILQLGGKTRELVGGEDNTTNNRMELTAVIRALEALKRPCEVELHTDSQYVKNGITSWIIKWKKNNWKRGKGHDAAPVLNVDLWRELDAAAARHKIDFKWVRGHAGNSLNERCDELCSAEIYRRERGGRG